MKYTVNQQKAIDHWEGNLQIIACAGSGKTDVITRRIAKLVSTGVPKESIVAFTENAAEEMKYPIRNQLQELRPDNTELATDYMKQLRLYAIASILTLGFHPKQATVHYLDEVTSSEVDISQDILDDVEDEISETVLKIMNRKFSKHPIKKKCNVCDWLFFCTKTK